MLKRIIYILAAGLLTAAMTACAGSRANQVETPAGMNMQRGRNYKEVIEDFEDKGFTNIKTETIEDLEFGWTVKNEEVEEILVGGDRRYDAGVWVPADTEVVIRYHTYNRKAPEEEAGQDQPAAGDDKAAGNAAAEKNSGQNSPDQKTSDQNGPDQAGSQEKAPDQTGSEKKASDQKTSDRKDSDQTGAAQGATDAAAEADADNN